MESSTHKRYSGRVFSREAIEQVRELIRTNPQANRQQLSYRVCEHFDWRKPDGSLKKFLEGEIRYASLKRTFPEEAERLHTTLVDQFNKRYEELALMADPTLVCQQEEPAE